MGDIETKLGQSLDDLIKKTSVPRAPRRKKRGKKSQKETKKVGKQCIDSILVVLLKSLQKWLDSRDKRLLLILARAF